ncbi:hypothetical protein [Brevibacillus dissolubilis]|uniref:hypothetical protein n=1 Tax=Brevibacillus dissolubilis TaxID=1844116 RepID=UPI0011162EBD|nr:hypothetical protein [Brevibacillus dissolubilis]
MKKIMAGAALLFLTGFGIYVASTLSDESNVQTVTEMQEKVTDPTPAASSWAYPFVIWQKRTYMVTDETITEIGKELGQVTTHSDQERAFDRNKNFSNLYSVGTKYFEITGIDPNTAIAVESNGSYVKAVVQEGK